MEAGCCHCVYLACHQEWFAHDFAEVPGLISGVGWLSKFAWPPGRSPESGVLSEEYHSFVVVKLETIDLHPVDDFGHEDGLDVGRVVKEGDDELCVVHVGDVDSMGTDDAGERSHV